MFQIYLISKLGLNQEQKSINNWIFVLVYEECPVRVLLQHRGKFFAKTIRNIQLALFFTICQCEAFTNKIRNLRDLRD